ncbi:tetratricopeptide repeat protein, partial [Saccharopolyspora soli]|uniref:tetratricopeptide repeat protein n=1 Tax=Saccharopolyspora soli TaxID=2926618 RepID=UPI00355673C2
RHNLAGVLQGRGELAEAEAEYRAVLKTARRVLGDDNPSTLVARGNLASILRARQKMSQI